MGSFYTNICFVGPSQETLAEALRQRNRIAFVTPLVDGKVVVFDQECDRQDLDVISNLTSELSHELKCPALAVLNHDDDILWYQLYDKGELVDEYDSYPNYFNPKKKASVTNGGDAKKLCNIFGVGDTSAVEGQRLYIRHHETL
jgi:hypothetical protein